MSPGSLWATLPLRSNSFPRAAANPSLGRDSNRKRVARLRPLSLSAKKPGARGEHLASSRRERSLEKLVL
jgi:hypothetical protein